MIKTIIVDDEPASLEILRNYISAFENDIVLCASCSNMQDAIQAVNQYKPDILLLDIELGDGLSFEILERYPDLKAHIIFITAYDQYVLKAIKFHAFDYLFKPVIQAEFESTIRKALNNIRSMKPLPDTTALIAHLKGSISSKIAVPNKNGLSYYHKGDIVYVEADGSYSIMHMINTKTITITRKIKDFEESLVDNGFIRVHKSFLVNIQHISELHRDDSGYLVMEGGARIPISPKDKELIIQKIKTASHII
jgi:two-component system LytT family response regulator